MFGFSIVNNLTKNIRKQSYKMECSAERIKFFNSNGAMVKIKEN
jgi:hypothetical protein